MTKIRKTYTIIFFFRCLVFAACLFVFVLRPDEFDILQGRNFFRRFSAFHLLWGIWVVDMVLQLVPVKDKVALGSQKLFRQRFKPIRGKINYQALRQYVISTTKAAYKVMIVWIFFLAALGIVHHIGVISDNMLFLLSAAFYVGDLVCVLVWCPFRLVVQSRCCTTCRIFNWDHLFMFTPMMFIKGFFSISLLILALVVWLTWEMCVMLYPERFWEHSNVALRCSECTDMLCIQYCKKLRRQA